MKANGDSDGVENFTDEALRWLESELKFDDAMARLTALPRTRKSVSRKELAAIIRIAVVYRERFIALQMKELGI